MHGRCQNTPSGTCGFAGGGCGWWMCGECFSHDGPGFVGWDCSGSRVSSVPPKTDVRMSPKKQEQKRGRDVVRWHG